VQVQFTEEFFREDLFARFLAQDVARKVFFFIKIARILCVKGLGTHKVEEISPRNFVRNPGEV